MAFKVDAFVALASQQLAALVKFYQAFLQVDPSPCREGYAEFSLSGLRLAIFVPSADNIAVFFAQTNGVQTSGAMSLCLEVEDLEAAIARLTRIGYAPPGEIIQASHGREIYAYDPDGNRLILHQAK